MLARRMIPLILRLDFAWVLTLRWNISTKFTTYTLTSVEQMENLSRNGTYACGAVQSNRCGLPEGIKNCKLKKTGEEKKCKEDAWPQWLGAEKEVRSAFFPLLLDWEYHNHVEMKHGVPYQSYIKPIAIQEYTASFAGVDKSDQFCLYYGIVNNATKWWNTYFGFY